MSTVDRDHLHLDAVKIALNGKVLLSVDHRVEPGDILTIMGPSGSGKSTLLAFIGGFLDAAFHATGKVFCGNVELTALLPQRRKIGLLFQDPLLFPHMSVGGNLAFAAPQSVAGAALRAQKAQVMLDALDLSDYFDTDPDTLSGGQKARVALGRVLMSEPACLLLDEPFSKLDTTLRDQMRTLVFSRARETGLPVVLVTHDKADAEAAGGHIIHVGPV